MKWHSQRSLEFQRGLDQTALGSCHSVPLFLICEMAGGGGGGGGPGRDHLLPGKLWRAQGINRSCKCCMGPPAGSGSTYTVAMPTIHTIDIASMGLGLPPLSEDPATPWGRPRFLSNQNKWGLQASFGFPPSQQLGPLSSGGRCPGSSPLRGLCTVCRHQPQGEGWEASWRRQYPGLEALCWELTRILTRGTRD